MKSTKVRWEGGGRRAPDRASGSFLEGVGVSKLTMCDADCG